MSTVDRYTFEAREVLDANCMVISVGIVALTHPLGQYVKYDDYANMVDQRDAALMVAESGNALVKQLKDQLAEAKAENERLRTELDYVLDDWGCFKVGHSGGSGIDSVFKAWLAAKGVQS